MTARIIVNHPRSRIDLRGGRLQWGAPDRFHRHAVTLPVQPDADRHDHHSDQDGNAENNKDWGHDTIPDPLAPPVWILGTRFRRGSFLLRSVCGDKSLTNFLIISDNLWHPFLPTPIAPWHTPGRAVKTSVIGRLSYRYSSSSMAEAGFDEAFGQTHAGKGTFVP